MRLSNLRSRLALTSQLFRSQTLSLTQYVVFYLSYSPGTERAAARAHGARPLPLRRGRAVWRVRVSRDARVPTSRAPLSVSATVRRRVAARVLRRSLWTMLFGLSTPLFVVVVVVGRCAGECAERDRHPGAGPAPGSGSAPRARRRPAGVVVKILRRVLCCCPPFAHDDDEAARELLFLHGAMNTMGRNKTCRLELMQGDHVTQLTSE